MNSPFIYTKRNKEILPDLNIYNVITRPTLSEVHISDVHFGVLDPKYQYDILYDQFINKIIDISFDVLSINGDILDHKYLSNSDAVMYAIKFVNDCVNICRIKNATFVIIHGTLEHDANQLRLFYHYLNDPTIDIRIIEEVKFEYIKGAKILCIPELYGLDKEYYNKFLFNSGPYDSVFMHGEIKGAIIDRNSSNEEGKAPIFTIEDFKNCRGPIISGHVHTPRCLNTYFYYTGSPIYDKFGDEEKTIKGFLIVLHNLNTSQHYVHLEPIISDKYITINLDHLVIGDPKQIIDYVNQVKEEGIKHIRIEFTKELNEIESSNLQLIKNYYRNNSLVKIKNDNHKKIQQIKVNEEMMEKYKDYEYLLDPKLSEYTKFVQFVNHRQGYKFITVEELIELLEEEL